MAKSKTIVVDGSEIALIPTNGPEDFISLTDIMKKFDDEFAIYSWMRNKNTVEFLGVWEQLHNPDFKGNEFVTFKNAAGANNFNLTPKKWIEATAAVGILVKSGRYGSGTFAHRDIAVNFCYWLSPTFQLYLIKEFERLKTNEAAQSQNALEWNVRRVLSKVNYRLHTAAVRQFLVPPRLVATKMEGAFFASEADLLNLALFGQTAREWREANPNARGNLRDDATVEQLLVLSNLENLNSVYIKMGFAAAERLRLLNEEAIHQMELLMDSSALKKLT